MIAKHIPAPKASRGFTDLARYVVNAKSGPVLPVPIGLTTRDRRAIERRAAEAGLSLSAYLRAAGLGRPLSATPALDHKRILTLSRVNADQGWLGGLLKMWLVDRPGRGTPEPDVRALLGRISDTQGRLAEICDMIPLRENRRRR